MELTVLGSGTAVPHPLRSSAGFWLQTSAGSVLMDISAAALHRMAQENLPWHDLDAIWISHFHLDHCGGLGPFLFATRGAPEAKGRTKPLSICGPPGLRKLIETLDNANKNKLLDQPFPIEIVEIEPLERFEMVEKVEAVAYSTQHTDESHAIHIRDGETTFVYTSDTGFDEELATLARRVDLLLIESSFVKDKTVAKHLELAEAIYLIRRAEPNRAMITHFYAEWDEVDFASEVARFSPGCEVLEATDGLRVEVKK